MPSHSLCEHDCGPFGACLLDTLACEGNDCLWKCHCRHGYGGPDCSMRVDRCDTNVTHSSVDAHFCFNGGRCETYGADSSRTTRCNCHTAAGEAKTNAKRQCEFHLQQTCEEGLEFSSYAYCVNGGICNQIVPSGSPHPFCKCNKMFAGRHCQFLANDVPPEETKYVETFKDTVTDVPVAYNHTHSTHIVHGHTNAQPTSVGREVPSPASTSDVSHRNKFMIPFVMFSCVLLFLGIYTSRRKRRFQLARSPETDLTLDEIVFDESVAAEKSDDDHVELHSILHVDGEREYGHDTMEHDNKIV